MTRPDSVLFWDLDGTLLSTRGAGRAAWVQAAAEVWGRELDPSGVTTAGLTDVEVAAGIGRQVMSRPCGREIRRLIRRYEELLTVHLRAGRGAVLPGAREILEDLADRPGVLSLLLTGNTEAGARAKLGHFGLDRFLGPGAFADGTADRIEIARKGWRVAAHLLGASPAPDRAFVIGDTPHDIRCARALGARAVAVATGAYTAAELGSHGPWWVIERLPAPDAFAERLALPAPVAGRGARTR